MATSCGTRRRNRRRSEAGTTGRKEENRADRAEEQDSDEGEGEERSARTTRRKREEDDRETSCDPALRLEHERHVLTPDSTRSLSSDPSPDHLSHRARERHAFRRNPDTIPLSDR